MRHMDCVTRWNGLVCGAGSSEFALDGSVASLVALSPSRSTVSVGFVLEGSVAFSVALSPLRLKMRLIASSSWLRSRMLVFII